MILDGYLLDSPVKSRITITDLETAIRNGEIIENYPNDPRGPSCLILGFSKDQAIHIVCGTAHKKWIRIITVYIPKLPKWADPKTRSNGGTHNA